MCQLLIVKGMLSGDKVLVGRYAVYELRKTLSTDKEGVEIGHETLAHCRFQTTRILNH